MSEQASFRQRLARNTAASLLTNGWTMVLTFVSLPILLSGLGAKSFGVWVLIQTFSTTNGWLSVPATGVGISATRDVATAAGSSEKQIGHALGAAFTAFAVMGVFFATLMAIGGATLIESVFNVGGLNTRDLRFITAVFAGQLLIEHLFLAITSSLEGLQRVATARGVDAVRKTATAVLAAAVATMDGGLKGVVVSSAIATGLSTVVAAFVLARTAQAAIRRPPRTRVTAIFRYAGTVSALTGTGVLHRTMDRAIAGAVFGPEEVALLEIATQIQFGCTAALSAATYPMLSATPWLRARDDPSALRVLVDRGTRYSVMLTLPMVAGAIILAGPFIRVWVGDAFSEAIGLSQVAVAYVALVAPLQAGSNALQGLGRAGTVLKASALTVIANLVASLALVHVVGLVGVFVGTILGAAALVVVLGRAIVRETALPGWDSLIAALRSALFPTAGFAAVALLCVGAPVSDVGRLVAAVVVGGLVAVAATLRWSLTPDERRELMAALFRRGRPPTASG